MKPLILLIGSKEAEVLVNALVRHATACEEEGDVLSEALVADHVAEKVLELQKLDDESTRQVLLSLGLGVARGRPQG